MDVGKTVATACLALAAGGLAAQADAQTRYYARQHLVRDPNAPAPALASWTTGQWSGAPSCSQTAVRTRTVSCTKAGAAVDESQCPGTKPPSTMTGSYDACNTILQSEDLRNAGDGWWTGTRFGRAGDYGITLLPGGSITQVGVVPTRAGLVYDFQADAWSVGGSDEPKYHRVELTTGSGTITRTYNDAGSMYVRFTGDGKPITVTITNLGTRDIRYFVIRAVLK